MTTRGRKVANGEPSLDPSSSTSALNGANGETKLVVDGVLATALAPSLEHREEVKSLSLPVPSKLLSLGGAGRSPFLSRPDLFKQIYTHTDVRLALGWASVFVAAGTALYGYKIAFERSKPVVWAGLILYVLLTTIQTLYAYFVEGDIVFVGKRKTFDKRIVTERITLTSTTTPSTPSSPPAYALGLTYVRSTSGGKSLLGRGRSKGERGYNTFFDEQGVMDQDGFERWVGEMVGRVMESKTE
ncbi:uncharacterized protein FIBRA_02269 [Fibroporia radiculosa]|uniref:Signal peptidase complex subunit 2 n=1 Tax=Fibroporia radiculosa TaxID=599839 RepID=J4GMQ8_9APHY|nr:uncharacterized protein FIBRA_02269 [Fibroporia radiculosa]CCM00240.1 predicted protein [Fibroporia radiculosa]